MNQDPIWIILISLMLLIHLSPISSFVAAMPAIEKEWGINKTISGVIFSSYYLGYAIGALVLVPITDKVGSKKVLLYSVPISLLPHVIFPLLAQDVVTSVVLRTVSGIGMVGVYVPGIRIIAEKFEGTHRGFRIGSFVTAQYAANSVSLGMMGVFMGAMDWRGAYFSTSIVSLISVPMVFLLLRNINSTIKKNVGGKLDFAVLKDKRIRYFIIGYSLHAWQLHALRTWFPSFVLAAYIASGFDPKQAVSAAAFLAGMALLPAAIGPLIGGPVSDKYGRAKSAMAILILSAACAWIIGWLLYWPLWVIVLVAAIYAWATSADSPIYQTAITELANPKNLGATMAIQAFCGLICGLSGPIVFGIVLDLFGPNSEWIMAFSILGLIAITAIWFMSRLNKLSRPMETPSDM